MKHNVINTWCFREFYPLFFSSRFLEWDGKTYNEIIIDGETLRFNGKLFFQKQCLTIFIMFNI